MKIRPSIIGIVAVVAALILFLLWHGKKKPVEVPSVGSFVTTNAPAPGTTSIPPVNTPVKANTSSQTVTATSPPPDKSEQIKQGLGLINDVPVVFYGRLEDQFGNPVVGAQIAGNVRVYNNVQSTVEHLTTISDDNGLFQIKGGKGEDLGVMPKKAGYILAATNTEFKYSYMYSEHFTPDPNNPTVIKMWKLQGAEPLVSVDKKYKLQETSTPIYFDLISGTTVPVGGDLKITVNRPDGIISQQHPQNWSIQIEVVGGGLIETSFEESRTTYAAPESGYQVSDIVGNNNGPDLVDKMFFIQSRNGQIYSKVHLLFGINDTPDEFMSVAFNGVANTNSSRNWEGTVSQ